MRGFDAFVTRAFMAIPGWRGLGGAHRRLASFAEQGFQGLANLAANVILARALSHEGFATIGALMGIHYFVLGLHRTAIVLPFILDADMHEARLRDTLGRWWWLNFASLGAIAAVLTLLALACRVLAQGDPRWGWLVEAVSLSIGVCPALLFFEFGRRTLYQAGRAASAALASACYLVIIVASALVLTQGDAHAGTGAMAWVVAGLGSGGVASVILAPGPPRLREGFALWWANRSFAFWQALTNVPYAIYNASVAVPIGVISGPVAAAAFNAARALTNPAISIVSAVDSLDKPRAAKALRDDGCAGLTRSIRRTRRLLVLITGAYLALVIVLAEPLLHIAFGETYAMLVNEMRVLAIAFFLMCLNQPSETLLIVLRESRLLLALRSLTAAIALVSLLVATRFGVMGCCLALLVTQSLNLGLLRFAERVGVNRHSAVRSAPNCGSLTCVQGSGA